VLGFGTAASLAQNSAPLNQLAAVAGVGWLAYFLDLAVAVSAAVCVSASLNAAARAVYSLGREDILPSGFGSTHSKFRTPHVAILTLAPVIGIVPFVLVAYGTSPLNIFGYLGTLATFGYLLAYALVSIAAPVFLRRRGALTPVPVAVSVLATATIGYVFYKNLVPVPPNPYDTFPYIFLAWILIGLTWYLVLKARDPERAARLGTFQDQEGADLEARIAAELAPGPEGAGQA
jgi:amino acid transporter